MRYISYTTITVLFYAFIIAFLVYPYDKSIYASNIAISSNTLFDRPFNKFEPICDDEYRSKYIKSKINRGHYSSLNSSKEKFKIDFLPFETSGMEVLPNDREDSSEFMEHGDPFRNYHSLMKRPICFNKEMKRIYRKGRKIWKRICQRKIKNIGNLNKKRWKNVLLKSKKEDKKIESNFYYKNGDNFGSIIIGRRNNSQHENSSKTDDSHDGWSDQACKSMRRIVGGWSPESAEQFPYMAFIDTGCGGAVIGNIWVLTAAHCLDEANPKYVYAGSLELLGGCQFNVDQIYIHPKFTREKMRYDIGLLSVNPKFIYSPVITPISLSKRHARYGMCGVVTGWGAEKYQGTPTYRLLMSLIPIVSREKCKMFRIKKGQFCAGYKNAIADTCQGDSGGPFVVDNRVIGIVSYGSECATRETPAVYVDIYYYRNWIRSITGITSRR